MTALFKQYFKNGLELVARKRNLPLCKIKVVIFQLIIKMPVATPVIAAPAAFTVPRYSGARNNVLAPKNSIKFPDMVKKRMSHKTNKTWDFLKCSSNNCIGNE
jgi:hypothetical protein